MSLFYIFNSLLLFHRICHSFIGFPWNYINGIGVISDVNEKQEENINFDDDQRINMVCG